MTIWRNWLGGLLALCVAMISPVWCCCMAMPADAAPASPAHAVTTGCCATAASADAADVTDHGSHGPADCDCDTQVMQATLDATAHAPAVTPAPPLPELALLTGLADWHLASRFDGLPIPRDADDPPSHPPGRSLLALSCQLTI